MLFSLLLPLGFASSTEGISLFGDVCDGRTSDSTVCEEQRKSQSLNDNSIYGPNGVIIKVVNIVAFVAGIAAVIFIIIGGIKYITSSGDPSNVSSAKRTIIYAIVGVVVVVLARTLIAFIINRL
jgi:hypothetical protein